MNNPGAGIIISSITALLTSFAMLNISNEYNPKLKIRSNKATRSDYCHDFVIWENFYSC